MAKVINNPPAFCGNTINRICRSIHFDEFDVTMCMCAFIPNEEQEPLDSHLPSINGVISVVVGPKIYGTEILANRILEFLRKKKVFSRPGMKTHLWFEILKPKVLNDDGHISLEFKYQVKYTPLSLIWHSPDSNIIVRATSDYLTYKRYNREIHDPLFDEIASIIPRKKFISYSHMVNAIHFVISHAGQIIFSNQSEDLIADDRHEITFEDTIATMQSADYKERFKAEFYQLKIRIDKLSSALKKDERGTLNFTLPCSHDLLLEQLEHMKAYAVILEHRATIEGIEL